MANFSFDIKNSRDFFIKLQQDYDEYNLDKISSRKALNCTMTAYHLCDWIFNEYKTEYPEKTKKEYILNQCPSLKIMRDLTNGTKHYQTGSSIKTTDLHKGVFAMQFSRPFDISTLTIKMKNGQTIYFEDEIKIVFDFWKLYLTENFNIDI